MTQCNIYTVIIENHDIEIHRSFLTKQLANQLMIDYIAEYCNMIHDLLSNSQKSILHETLFAIEEEVVSNIKMAMSLLHDFNGVCSRYEIIESTLTQE